MDASLIQVAGPTDVVLTAFFEGDVGNHRGAMSIWVRYTVIEPIASRLSSHVWFSSQRKLDERAVRAMEGLVSRMDVECDVRLGSVELPAATVAKMQEGDTLVLDTNRVAVQVADVVDEPIFEFQDTALSMDPPDQVSAPQAAVPPQPASLNPGSEPPPAIPQVAEAASASGADSGTEVEQRSA
jgi:hypothetical protein